MTTDTNYALRMALNDPSLRLSTVQYDAMRTAIASTARRFPTTISTARPPVQRVAARQTAAPSRSTSKRMNYLA